MADEETKQDDQSQQEPQEQPETEAVTKDADEPKKGSMLQWIIMGAVIVVLSLAGIFTGSMFGSGPKTADADTQTEDEAPAEPEEDSLLVEDAASAKGWYYDLDPVATNLNEPGSTRYVRAVLTLEMQPEIDMGKGTEFLDEHKPVVANILNIYFAGLAVEDLNSDKDMRRIQYELLELFNEQLYGKAKPLIKQVLFREFGLQ